MKYNARSQWQQVLSSLFFQTSCFLCLACSCAGLLFPATLHAEEFSQKAHYSVRMFSYGMLTIDTRVGDLRIEGWDEPRLDVEAEKVVSASSEAKGKRLFEQIGIQVEGSDKAVRIRTLYPPRRLWRPFRGASKLSVNFRIHMPYDANLTLKCVDGDVRILGISGHQRIRVSYGDVEIDVPSVYALRWLDARAWLGYVESDLHGEGNAGFGPKVSLWNPAGDQEIYVRVRMGGVFIYGEN